MGVTPYKLKSGKKRWRADTWLVLPDGRSVRYVKQGLPTKEMAERLLDKARIDAFEGRYFERKKRNGITVRELWNIYKPISKEQNRGWDRVKSHVAHVIEHLGNRRAASLTVDDVTKYREARRTETFGAGKIPAVSTLNREVSHLRKLLNFAVQAKKLDRNPLAGIRGLIVPEDNTRDVWATEEEFARLLECAEDELRPILLVAYDCGMRKSEILSLKWSQVILRGEERGFIRLSLADTKSRKPREIPLTARVRGALDELPRSMSGYVFTNPKTGTRWNQIKKKFQRARTGAEMEHLRFHDLRRSFVTNARKRGLPESVIMRISGHKTRTVFERYNIINDEDVREAVKVIEAGQRTELEAAKKEKLGKDTVMCRDGAL